MARSKSDKVEEPASSAFSKHAQRDEALLDQDGLAESSSSSTAMTLAGRIMVFLVFPLTAGTIGLYMGYLESIRRSDKKISFDQDFVMPFLLALAMAVVLFLQTGGFSSNKVKPLVAWPKVRRVKKVIKKKKGEAAADKIDYDSNKKKED